MALEFIETQIEYYNIRLFYFLSILIIIAVSVRVI